MGLFIHNGAAWKEVTQPSFHNGTSFVDLTKVMVNVSGTWMNVWEANTLIWSKDTFLVLDGITASQMNEAISKMSNGGMLLFGAGEWLLESSIVIDKSNITIKGVSGLTTLKCNGNFSTTGCIRILGTSALKTSDIVIEDIIIDGNNSNSKVSTGMETQYVKGVRISNCVIKNNSNNGLTIYTASTNVKIINNSIQNNTLHGIGLYSSSSDNTITNNTIQNNSGNGIYLATSNNNNTLNGNTIQNNSGNGIYLYLSSNNNIISGNTIQNNKTYGIYLQSSNNNTVNGNTVQNNNSSGVYLQSSSNNNTITSNTVQNNGGYYGVFLHSSNYNIVVSNAVQSNQYGIYIHSATPTPTNNLINGNVSVSNQTSNFTDSGVGTVKNYNITL